MVNSRLIIAHRGASAYEKMNTIAAFKKAIEMKADMIEFDVRKTKDNKIIIFHDSRINNAKISELKFKRLIKIKKDIPKLEEALKILKNKTKIDVHLKEEGYEKEAIKIILKYFKEKDIVICSEFPDSLKRTKEINEKIRTGLILNYNLKNFLTSFGTFSKKEIFDCEADYIMPKWQLVNILFLTRAERFKIKVFPWVVNDKKLAERFLKKDIIGGIVTDIPDLMQD